MIKYSPWSKDNIDEIKNKDNAIERWSTFLLTASPIVLNSIR